MNNYNNKKHEARLETAVDHAEKKLHVYFIISITLPPCARL